MIGLALQITKGAHISDDETRNGQLPFLPCNEKLGPSFIQHSGIQQLR